MKFCLFLLAAGLTDAVLTQFGILVGVINEGNPLMEVAIQKSWVFFYLIKILLPVALIGLFYLQPLKGKSKVLLVSTCVLYVSVLFVHLVWIFLYLNESV
jgi:hypothetical protein